VEAQENCGRWEWYWGTSPCPSKQWVLKDPYMKCVPWLSSHLKITSAQWILSVIGRHCLSSGQPSYWTIHRISCLK
jgi:hypothetical protein